METKYKFEYYKKWKVKKLVEDPNYFKYNPENYKKWKDKKLSKDPDYFTKDRAEYYKAWKAKKLAEDPEYFKRVRKKSEQKIKNLPIPDLISKICISCKIEKDINSFSKVSYTYAKYARMCRTCDSSRQLTLYYSNVEENRKKRNEYYHANSQKILERQNGNTATKQRRRKYEDLQFAFISDSYLRHHTELKELEKIPSILYEAKRNYLKLKRKVNEK